MEKVIKDGYVAVLFSPGFGAGWSTWNRESPELIFDPNIVHYVEKEDKESLQSYCELKYPSAYLGGMDDLTIAWIKEGTFFRVNEYDGSESIETKEDVDWLIA